MAIAKSRLSAAAKTTGTEDRSNPKITAVGGAASLRSIITGGNTGKAARRGSAPLAAIAEDLNHSE
jgi:hypothetical protein